MDNNLNNDGNTVLVVESKLQECIRERDAMLARGDQYRRRALRLAAALRDVSRALEASRRLHARRV